MFAGIHALVFSNDPAADRAFFRDVLELPGIDTGGGWWIFALPPAELGVHPPIGDRTVELQLMCHDLDATMRTLAARGATFDGAITEETAVGRFTSIRLPGGGTIGLYQPVHPTPLTGFPRSAAP